MRRYLVVLLLLVGVPILTFCVASEWLIRTHVAPNQNIEAHAEFLRTATHANAAFGDSHVAMGITGSEDIVTLGFPADGINHIIGKASLYYNRVKPGKVILQADLQQLTPGRLLRSFESERFLYSGNPWLREWVKLSVPVFRANLIGHWRNFLSGGEFVERRQFSAEDGSQTSNDHIGDWDDQQVSAFAETILYDSRALSIDPRHPVLLRYEALARLLRERGAQVCFVTYPLHPLFWQQAQSMNTTHEAAQFYADLATTVGARYVDLSNMQLAPDQFFDPDHLSRTGGETFTRVAMKRCFH
jgi:hypothetical protein